MRWLRLYKALQLFTQLFCDVNTKDWRSLTFHCTNLLLMLWDRRLGILETSCQEVQYWPIGRETVYNGWSRLTWYRAHGRTYMVVASSLTKSTCFSAHLTSNAYYMWKDTEILYSNNPAHMVYGMHYFSVLSNMVTAHVSPSGQFKLILSFSGQFYCTPGLVSQQEMVISVASPATKSLLTLYSLILHVFTISLQY